MGTRGVIGDAASEGDLVARAIPGIEFERRAGKLSLGIGELPCVGECC